MEKLFEKVVNNILKVIGILFLALLGIGYILAWVHSLEEFSDPRYRNNALAMMAVLFIVPVLGFYSAIKIFRK